MSPARRKCAVPGCEKLIAPGYLMCGRHWFRVPTDLRKRIWWFYNERDFGPAYDAVVSEAVHVVLEEGGAA